MLNKLIDLERLTTFFQGLKDIFLQKDEASTTYATKTEVSNKVDKVEGKGLSTLDYNESDKAKLDKFTETDGQLLYNNEKIEGTVPNLTLNELTLGARFKISYNDVEDSLDIEVI